MLRPLILLFTLLAATALPAAELPPEFKAHYVVRKGPLTLGVASRELVYADDGRLVYKSRSDTTGLADMLVPNHIHETTTLTVKDGRLLPVEYVYSRTGKREREIQQQFDWVADRVSSRVDGVDSEYALEGPTFDPSSYQVNLMADLAGGRRAFSYRIAGRNGLKTYDIKHIGDERIETGLGTLDTVVVQRKSSRTTTLWCAAELHYLPVRIEHDERGSTFTAYLKSVEGLGGSKDSQ